MLSGVSLSLSSAAWAQQPPAPKTVDEDAPTVLVVAQRDQAETSFKADRSDTTTRSGADLRDVPQSVTVITSKVLESQQATSLQDALRNVSGIAFTESPQGLPTFSVRGFSNTSTTTNGVTDRGATLTSVFGVERVEVLKGPQAILAGAGSLGGGVNVVTKKPQAQTIRNLTFQYGSHGDATLAADLSGALSADNKLTYRLIASQARASDTTVGYDGRKDKFILPQLRWKDAATDLIVGLSYGEQHMPPPTYTFALRSGAILPRPAMLLSNPADGFDTTQKRVFYQLEQKLSSWLTFESRLQRALGDDLLHLYTPFGIQYGTGANANVSLGTSPFSPGNNRTLSRTTSGDHYLRANFSSGPIRHKLALGYNQIDTDSVQYQGSGSIVSVGLYPASGFAFADSQGAAATIQGIYTSRQKQQSYYLQDLLSWGDWNVQLNARHTRVDTGGNTTLPTSNYNQDLAPNRASKTTPGVGVVYKLTPDASVYASVANGFATQISNLCGGGVPPAQTTRNKEVGAKFGLLDNKLSLTSSLFQLEQSNLLQYITATRCYVPRDAQQTRGAELDLQGQLAPGWNAIANYTYNVYRDLGANGTLFPGLPKHKASLWTTYDFQGAALQGWGVGAGLNAVSHSIGSRSAATQFTLPGQARLDASLFYRKDRWDVTLGVKNLGDRLLYGVSTSNSYIPVLEGRNYMLTVRHSFQ
ncbi:MAG: TonB-dependent receptor [Duganella sp.]